MRQIVLGTKLLQSLETTECQADTRLLRHLFTHRAVNSQLLHLRPLEGGHEWGVFSHTVIQCFSTFLDIWSHTVIQYAQDNTIPQHAIKIGPKSNCNEIQLLVQTLLTIYPGLFSWKQPWYTAIEERQSQRSSSTAQRVSFLF